MHRISFACFVAFVALAGTMAPAQVIDRIVAVVDNHIITLSDVRQERSIRAGLGDPALEVDSVLIQQLVDNYLIESQMGDFSEADVTEDEVTEQLKKIQAVDQSPNPALREAIRHRLRMSKYFDVRFRQFIRPSDDDIKKYYDEVFVPAARASGLDPIPPMDSITDAVRENVVNERLNHEVNIWLEAIRRRSFIEILK